MDDMKIKRVILKEKKEKRKKENEYFKSQLDSPKF